MEDTENAGIPLDDNELSKVSGGMRALAEGKTLFDIVFGSYSDGREHNSEVIGGVDHGK